MKRVTRRLALLGVFYIGGTLTTLCQWHGPDRRFDFARAEHTSIPYSASSDTVFSVLGRWAWGPCKAVDAKGIHVYIGNGPTFQALDFSNPNSPSIVSEIVTAELINDIRVRDTLVFVCNEIGLSIYDVSVASDPRLLSSMNISGIPVRLAVVDSFVYVLTDAGSVRVVDYSNPQSPRMRGSIGVNDELPPCIAARGRYAYVGRREVTDIEIINATNPDSLTRMEFIVGGFTTSAFVHDTVLLLGMSPYRIKTYSVSDPSTPRLLGQVQLPGPTISWAITVADSFAFVVAKDSGVYSIDISNLALPRVRGLLRRRILPSNLPTTMAVSGMRVFAAFYNGLLTVDGRNPDTLTQTSFFASGGYAENVVTKDTVAYVASGYSGLWLVSIADPRHPKAISNIITGGYTCDVTVMDSIAAIVNCDLGGLVPDSTRGLWTVGVSNPCAPVALGHYIGIVKYTGSYPYTSIGRQENVVLLVQPGLSSVDSVLELVDIRSPRFPTRLGVFRAAYWGAYHVVANNNIAYLATADRGLRLIDFSNPGNPQEVSDILASARGISVRGQYAFALRESLFVIDVSYPQFPRIVGTTFMRVSNTSFRSSIAGNYLYWVHGDIGAVDISNPHDPIQRTRYIGRGPAAGIVAADNKVFVTHLWQGLSIMQNRIFTIVEPNYTGNVSNGLEVLQNFPNPSNSFTFIRFYLSVPDKVEIEVFNVLGQKVSTLSNEYYLPGMHSVDFDASLIPSGVYFYRVRGTKNSITRKMLLLR